MNKRKKIVSILFLIGIIYITFIVFITIADFRIPFFNPPEEERTIPIPLKLYYANITPIPDIEICLFLQYEGILVEGKEVTLSAIGYLNTPKAMNTTHIEVGLRLCYAYPSQYDDKGMPVGGSLWLFPDGEGKLYGNSTTAYWATPGDYAPMAVMHEPNRITPIEFPLTNVHVEPASALLAEKYNHINLGLSYAFFYFGLIGAIYICFDIFKKDSS